jgi:RNA 2',3'-cyclic 3'-phosphodiesterase
VRLFVALELPADLRSRLAQWGAGAARSANGLRVLAPDTLHVTLCFLGWRSLEEIEQIGAACQAVSAQRAAPLSVLEGSWLPAHRPRVLAVALSDPGGRLGQIQSTLSDVLHAGGFYQPEARPYLPHVTVARVGRGARVRELELPPPPRSEFLGSTVTLYRSRLTRAGARYEPQHTVPLVGR